MEINSLINYLIFKSSRFTAIPIFTTLTFTIFSKNDYDHIVSYLRNTKIKLNII